MHWERAMTDLELTRLCAEAMGISVSSPMTNDGSSWTVAAPHNRAYLYDPLHDDTQAMALVKKFKLGIVCFHDSMWSVNNRNEVSQAADLNRAICECVAKMQAAKSGASHD